MRVQMKATVSGTRDGVPWPAPGGIVDLPDAEAEHLLAAGLAKHPEDDGESGTDAAPEPVVEEATATPAETSTPSRRKTTK